MAISGKRRVPPDVPALLTLLIEHDVRFILAGSVAVEAWGADVGTPGDLDIVPATNHANLARLAGVMREVHAQSWPVTGQWIRGGEDEDEVTWEGFASDDPRRGQHLPTPDPGNVATFDSLLTTDHGELDFVPHICGTFAWLLPRAVELTVRGVKGVRVSHIDDLLGFLTAPRRKKDIARVAKLRENQRQLHQVKPD